jgi:hypothetical protein
MSKIQYLSYNNCRQNVYRFLNAHLDHCSSIIIIYPQHISHMTYLQDMQQLCREMATMTRMLLAPMIVGYPLMSHPRILLTVGQAEFDPRNLHTNVINTYRVGS